jgi:hypothetical protein
MKHNKVRNIKYRARKYRSGYTRVQQIIEQNDKIAHRAHLKMQSDALIKPAQFGDYCPIEYSYDRATRKHSIIPTKLERRTIIRESPVIRGESLRDYPQQDFQPHWLRKRNGVQPLSANFYKALRDTVMFMHSAARSPKYKLVLRNEFAIAHDYHCERIDEANRTK